ncbi:hypothetical protein NU08_0463 [Flavobacterium anhuiense]|uniref:Uncharacterized protein n=1 Tax=Flavobacterium anhuiense TaxID=459526 RepID=A0A444W5N4_9FLAO|nr:hypothetical protein NU08_0463 [Flavobacterium anhuiense]
MFAFRIHIEAKHKKYHQKYLLNFNQEIYPMHSIVLGKALETIPILFAN